MSQLPFPAAAPSLGLAQTWHLLTCCPHAPLMAASSWLKTTPRRLAVPGLVPASATCTADARSSVAAPCAVQPFQEPKGSLRRQSPGHCSAPGAAGRSVPTRAATTRHSVNDHSTYDLSRRNEEHTTFSKGLAQHCDEAPAPVSYPSAFTKG